MKQSILSNWNIFRVLRLGLGIAIVVQAVMARDMLFGIAGTLFTLLAVFNIGCCATSACYTPQKKDVKASVNDTSYEEVV